MINIPIHCTIAKERQPGLDFAKKRNPPNSKIIKASLCLYFMDKVTIFKSKGYCDIFDNQNQSPYIWR